MKIQTTQFISDFKIDESSFKTETLPTIDRVKIGLSLDDLKVLEKNLEVELGLKDTEYVFRVLKELMHIDIRLDSTVRTLFPNP